MSKHVGFNYESLSDSKLRTEAKKQADHINKLLKGSTESIVEIGRRLNAIRKSMSPKSFSAWVESEFHWTQPTASNYMQSARVFGDLDCIASFQPLAMIKLSRTNIPQKILDSMIARARAGEVITSGMVSKALKENPEFKASRRDAGIARKPNSQRSIAHADEGTSAPMTFATLQKSLDSFSTSLPLLELSSIDRDALANRFFELAVQLRTLKTNELNESPTSAPVQSGASNQAQSAKTQQPTTSKQTGSKRPRTMANA